MANLIFVPTFFFICYLCTKPRIMLSVILGAQYDSVYSDVCVTKVSENINAYAIRR